MSVNRRLSAMALLLVVPFSYSTSKSTKENNNQSCDTLDNEIECENKNTTFPDKFSLLNVATEWEDGDISDVRHWLFN